jgi:hypothetical protein
LNASTPFEFVDRVEAAIRSSFMEGLTLTTDVCQYIESTLGAAEPAAVAERLAGPDDGERDTLLELVFFPDAGFQRRLEPVLEGYGLAATDRDRLAGRLTVEPARARLVFPSHSQRLNCALPVEGVTSFLTRLNLGWSIAPRLREALEQWDEKHARDTETGFYDLVVKLRNADLSQSQGQVRLLMDFLARMPATDGRWGACFDFLMAFLPAHGETLNQYRALMARKMFLVHHLIKARRNVETMSRSNMETLSMTGFRAAHFDMAAARQVLSCIDAIVLAVYGRTEHFDDAPVSMDLGQADGVDDLERIVRRLL